MTKQRELFSTQYYVYLVPAEKVAKAWDKLFPLVYKSFALSAGEYDEEDIFTACLEGRMYLWAVIGDDKVFYASAVTELAIYPKAVHYWVVLLGGFKMSEWQNKLQTAFEAHARRCGATWIRCLARKGMERQLASLGYKHTYVSLGKPIVENF